MRGGSEILRGTVIDISERAWAKRPFESVAALHAAMLQAVADAAANDQDALIHAYPDLGSLARMSAESAGEHTGAALNRLSASEHERLDRLNSAYREKFGFPFIDAVKGASLNNILSALESRLAGDRDAERATALAQIYRIARFRLEEILHAPIHERP